MKAAVIYDTVHGNTEQVARAIGEALGSPDQVRVIRAADALPGDLNGLDLLVVGSPTHGGRPTPAIKKLLKDLPDRALQGIRVAALDTRVPVSEVNSRVLSLFARLFGYAAKPIANALAQKTGELIAAPEGFFVIGTEGPLKEGEIERAADWARGIAATP